MAHPLFQCVRRDIHLWVWELGPFSDSDFIQWLEHTEGMISRNLDSLAKLKFGSTDYTLHLTLNQAGPCIPIAFTHSFLKLAGTAGFSLEIYASEQ